MKPRGWRFRSFWTRHRASSCRIWPLRAARRPLGPGRRPAQRRCPGALAARRHHRWRCGSACPGSGTGRGPPGDRAPATGTGRFHTPTGPACAAARAGPRGVGDTRTAPAAPYGCKRTAPKDDLWRRVGWPDGTAVSGGGLAHARRCAVGRAEGEEHGRSGGAARSSQHSAQLLRRVSGPPALLPHTRAVGRPPGHHGRPIGPAPATFGPPSI
jgi:hypothetical protein